MEGGLAAIKAGAAEVRNGKTCCEHLLSAFDLIPDEQADIGAGRLVPKADIAGRPSPCGLTLINRTTPSDRQVNRHTCR
jgi:hypothetical protein